MKANEFLRDNGIVKCSRIVEDLSEQGVDSDFTKDLKRLVESHELVELTGGLEMAKSVLDIEINAKHYEYDASKVTQLSKAIAGVESCQ